MLPCEEAKAQSQKVPARRKAPGPARPAAPSLAESLAAPLLDALTDPDESWRQANTAHVLRTCLPATLALLCRGLVERLLAGPAEGRRAARASLLQVGAAAVPAVYCRLLHARNPGTQLALVEALAAIGAGLPTPGRMDLMVDLMIVRGRAADGAVVEAIDGAVATLRRLNERAARANTPRRQALQAQQRCDFRGLESIRGAQDGPGAAFGRGANPGGVFEPEAGGGPADPERA
jgi:hypothetical protein